MLTNTTLTNTTLTNTTLTNTLTNTTLTNTLTIFCFDALTDIPSNCWIRHGSNTQKTVKLK